MALTNNAVSLLVGLTNSASVPGIGASTSVSLGYTEGYASSATLVDVATGSTPLNSSLGGDYGFLLVVNQSVQDMSILVGSTACGKLPAATAAGKTGGVALIPCSSGVIINATVPATTGQAYVATVRASANV